MNEKQKAVAIDLGTTFSVVAHINRENRPETIVNEEGDLSTPSVVFFDHDGPVVGVEATNAAEFEPGRVAQFAKRDMGNESYSGDILGTKFPPEVVQALILKKLKNDAELRIGSFDKAVITVPAYFNEPRRKATQDAGSLAGLEVIDLINEPTAAAIAYGVKQGFLDSQGEAQRKERVLVYDLGGGTFDVTLMEIEKDNFRAIATAGDVHLGGIDWDQRIAESLTRQFHAETGLELGEDQAAQEKFRQLASRAKKTLSARSDATVRMAHLGKHAQLKISRQEFEELTADLTERTRLTLRRLLKDASMNWADLTQLILVGGSTRMPMISSMLEQESGMAVDRSLSPDEAVAHGAAVYAGIIMRRDGLVGSGVSVSNVNSHDLGVLGIDPATRSPRRQIMIPRNSSIPIRNKKKFITSKVNQKEIVVTVIEGGTDNGEGATRIGKCHVANLPAVLPKGAPVNVTFEYSNDGRLSVNAELPNTDCVAQTTIERSSGMDDHELIEWKIKIDAGILIDPKIQRANEKSLDVDSTTSVANQGSKKVAGSVNIQGKSPATQATKSKDPDIEEATTTKNRALNLDIDAEEQKPVSNLPEYLSESESQVLASNTNVDLPDFEQPVARAGESILDALDNDKKNQEQDSALDDFLKGLE